MEWCAGPGFIGFRILSDKLCNHLTLVEGYYPAIQALEKTCENLEEKYKDRVNIVHLSDMSNLDKRLRFDLIVANPPFFNHRTYATSLLPERTCFDWGWKTHNNFFENIGQHLTDNGVILLQESCYGSCPDDFRDAINSNGLQIISSFTIVNVPDIWYLEIVKTK
jgi:tRNA1(Val) A37 N6-methylase TrmN6